MKTLSMAVYLATFIPDWNSLDSVRTAHSRLELSSIVFFGLLALAEAIAHKCKDEKRKDWIDTAGIVFFVIAVLCEAAAYPYGQRNDTLSEQVIGSLDGKAQHASNAAATALTNSGNANDAAKGASTAAGNAKDEADKVGQEVAAISKRADTVSDRLGQVQLLLSGRTVLNPESLKKGLLDFVGEKITFRSYLGDSEGYWLCTSLAYSFRPEVNSIEDCGKSPSSGGMITNIVISASTEDEMMKLSKLLVDAGIQGGTSFASVGAGQHPSETIVFVGSKVPVSLVQGPIRQSPPTHQKRR